MPPIERPPGRPLVLGHRGASLRAPQNTVEAFRLAMDQGADGVELDVRLTADGELALHHDPRVDGEIVSSLSLARLRELQPDLATLDDAAGVLAGAIINIEIKNSHGDVNFDPSQRAAALVAGWVASRGWYDRVLVTSFSREAIAAVRAADPRIVTGRLLDPFADAAGLMPGIIESGHQWVVPHKRLVTRRRGELVELAHEAGLAVGVWTVDEHGDLQAVAAAGVDAVITNDPAVALAVYG